MTKDEAKRQYELLFDSDESKAKAFDQIAQRYYFTNFGSVSKADLDVLLFSLYLDRLLDVAKDEYSAYSDYTLSKLLGITQTRVSSLKVRKELLYPYEGFSWQESFLRISKRAIFEDNRIKLYIPDRNLYLEVKNAIESSGGYVEVQLTPTLLQVRLEYFLDLLVALEDQKKRKDILKEIRKRAKEFDSDLAFMEKESFGKALLKKTPEYIVQMLSQSIPVFGPIVQDIANNIINEIQFAFQQKRKDEKA